MRIGRGDAGEHVLDQLSAYIDYELTDAERERVRAHLRRCPSCENELATLKATKQLLTEGPLHAAPRSFLLTPDMVGHVMSGPVERRRSFGWSLAGRLRTATALVALLLVAVLSGDFLTQVGLNSNSGAVPVLGVERNSGPAGSSAGQAENSATSAAAEATTTAYPPVASGAATNTQPPQDSVAAAPTGTPDQLLGIAPAVPAATPAPAAPLSDAFTNLEAVGTPPTGLFYRTQPLTTDTAPKAAEPQATATVVSQVSGWQLAEGALLVLLLVLGLGALWARARGV